MESTIRLFKVLPIESHENKVDAPALHQKTLSKYGFVFSPEVVAEYGDHAGLIKAVNDAYGRNPEELNSGFHKSFATIRDTSLKQLYLQQMLHYVTTYGFEQIGMYSEDRVYIPAEMLDAPNLIDVSVVIIRGMTKSELKERLLALLSAGIALHERTIKDVVEVAKFVDLNGSDLENIANREVRVAMYDHLGTLPSNPEEFLRFVVYKTTGKTLLIKNAEAIGAIKNSDVDVAEYFGRYSRAGFDQRLARIFYRYKPLFLAFRSNEELRPMINKIRKLAVANHKPMQSDYLNTVTSKLASELDQEHFENELKNANPFRKIRLAYALKFRTTEPESIMYRVRNGKSYAKEFDFKYPEAAREAYEHVETHIVSDLAKNVSGKKVFVPAGIRYALPATEKQFTGNLPSGTYVELNQNMVCGVYWEDVDNYRVDLDLSMSNADGKFGWDGYYRDSGGIYYSGDVVNAADGASEMFYIGTRARGIWMMNVNYFNYNQDANVPFKIFVAEEERRNVSADYLIDPNKIIAQSNGVMSVQQKNLGIVMADDNSARFYFAESNLGKGMTTSHKDYSEHAMNYLVNYYKNSISFNDLLVRAGAELVGSPVDSDIDLSPEAIARDSFIDLLT